VLLVIGRVQCAPERRDQLVEVFATGLLELVSARPEVAIHEIAETKPFPGSEK
jgi:hypothetical protein